jgi:hypothetical protein
VGSRRIKLKDLAYIAGFLDGDGSIMVQIKNRQETRLGWRLMFTICFYQDSRHKKPLQWIRDTLKIGYLSDRNDGITELRINGFNQVEEILTKLKPYIRFKAQQTKIALRILKKLEKENISRLPKATRLKIADDIIKLRGENYRAHNRRYSSLNLRKILGFASV